jgi:hypothetical protein
VRLDLGNRRTTITTLLEISEWCKTLADDVKWGFIRALAEAAGVDLPSRAPEAYAPLAWSEIRALERQGFSFGPHTVTHPILPRTTDAAAEWEIAQSWQRVRTEVQRPVGVFSFPNGAYGTREIEILERLGLDAAVTTRGAYASSGAPDAAGRKRFELPRFGYPEALDPMLLIASGFRRIELALAGLRTPGTGVLSRFSR